MSYKCPRCGESVDRSVGGAARFFGLAGALIAMGSNSFKCKKCGELAKSEFSPEDQNKMSRESILFIAIGAALLIGVI